jgi:hypothetical protein
VKAERPLGARGGAVHPEHVGQQRADGGRPLFRQLGGDLFRQIGEATLPVGFPEPAGAMGFEFGDHLGDKRPFARLFGTLDRMRVIEPREVDCRYRRAADQHRRDPDRDPGAGQDREDDGDPDRQGKGGRPDLVDDEHGEAKRPGGTDDRDALHRLVRQHCPFPQ